MNEPITTANCQECGQVAVLYAYRDAALCADCKRAANLAEFNPDGELTLAEWARSHVVIAVPPVDTVPVRVLSNHTTEMPACACCGGAMMPVHYFDTYLVRVLIGMACLGLRCKEPRLWAMGGDGQFTGAWVNYAERSA